MPESRNRDIATSAGQAVATDTIGSDGSLTGNVVTAYTNASDIPSSAPNTKVSKSKLLLLVLV